MRADKRDLHGRDTIVKRPLREKAVTPALAEERPSGLMLWSPAELVALLSVVAVAFVLKEVALGSLAFQMMPPSGQVVGRAAVLAFYYGAQIIAIAALALRRGFRLETAFGLWGEGKSALRIAGNVAAIVALLIATRAFSTAWAAALRTFGWVPPEVDGGQFSALFGSGFAGLALTITAVVIFAPIAEELVFRGAVLGLLADRIGQWPAILVSAGLFAASHIEPWIFMPTFVLGIALGWLARGRGSLAGAIVLHALYNGTAVVAAYYVAS